MAKYIIGIDEGTTSCRAGLYDVDLGKIIKIEQLPLHIYCPHEGYVEQDGDEIFNTVLTVVQNLLNSDEAKHSEILGIGITNQRESTVCFDKKTGKCVSKVINWQCRRTAKICNSISKSMKKYIKKKTGLVVDAYFSASKIAWYLQNVEETKFLREKGRLAFSTIESYLVYRLTNGEKFVTDPTNASRTMLFDIKKLIYDKKLLKYFNVKENELPEIIDNDEIISEIDICGRKIKLCGLIGDQQSSLFGQACFNVGEVKNTYGTGCFLLANTGEKVVGQKKLISSVAYKIKNDSAKYVLEGSVFNAGSCIQWLKDMKMINDAAETQKLCLEAVDSGSLVFVPALTGLGAPYWDMNARGLIIGINRATRKEHIVRAVVESIAYSTYDVFTLFKKLLPQIDCLKCDGGVSKNDFLMQLQSDITGLTILIPENYETTLLGAIYMCGLGVGVFSSLDQIKTIWKEQKRFIPNMDEKTKKSILHKWDKAILRSLNWSKNDN